MSKPGWKHYRAVQYKLPYLSGNIDLGIAFYNSGNRRIYGCVCWLRFRVDETRKACAGYVFILTNGPIRWKCGFIQEIPLSTREAEAVVAAMFEPIKTSIWINRVLESMALGETYTKGIVQIYSSIDSGVITPFTVFEDNKAAIVWSSNSVLSQKMRHVLERYCYMLDNKYWVSIGRFQKPSIGKIKIPYRATYSDY